jgi:cardiolipin synthase
MQLLKDINYKKVITSRIVVTAVMILMEFAFMLGIFVRAIRHSEIIMTAFYLLGFLYVIYLVSKDENASYRIGWLILILTLPPLGTFLYMLWGDKKPSRKLRNRLENSYKEFDAYLAGNEEVYRTLEKENPRVTATAKYIKKTSRYPLHQNTHVTYYPLGEEMFEAMLEEMKKAEHFIFLEFFIVEEGEMWGRMLEVLLEKARQGVEVRMLYDDMGSVALLPFDYAKKLEEMDTHIKCIPFNPVVPFLAMVMNNRDHRKILVVDGNIGFTGGVNLADEYINAREKYGHWKDSGLKLVGEGVWNLTVMFMEMWNACSETKLIPEMHVPKIVNDSEQEEHMGFVLPYGDDPLDDENVGEDTYIEIINQAKDYVYIITPYLILDDEMKRALIMASKRGVDVRIVTPGIPDKKVVFRLTRANYLPLLKAGVKIYEYTPGFVHAKSFLSDDNVGVVGTINLDYRSLYLHFECAVWMYQVPALIDLKKDTLETIEKSRRVYEEDVHTKGIGRLFDGLLRVMAPLF